MAPTNNMRLAFETKALLVGYVAEHFQKTGEKSTESYWANQAFRFVEDKNSESRIDWSAIGALPERLFTDVASSKILAKTYISPIKLNSASESFYEDVLLRQFSEDFPDNKFNAQKRYITRLVLRAYELAARQEESLPIKAK